MDAREQLEFNLRFELDRLMTEKVKLEMEIQMVQAKIRLLENKASKGNKA